LRPPLRPLALTLLLPLALALAACGGGGDDDATSGTTAAAATSTAAADTETAATEAASSAATGETAATEASSAESAADDTDSSAATTDGADASEPAESEAAGVEMPPTGPDGCTHVEPPTAGGERRTYDAPPSSGLTSGAAATAVLETSCGVIRISLDSEVGGVVTDSFAGLVRDGFYDGLTFHRVVPDFVLQGGDPEGTGAGDPGYEVTQAPPESYVYAKGDVAMAKLPSDPAGTAGSQFFVVVSPQGAAALGQPGEPPLYAVVGHILDEESMATVNRIAALGVGDGPPLQPVWIWQASLEQG
jgi:cyclophilin family peptidyl-prolyl cis-trans isomerase